MKKNIIKKAFNIAFPLLLGSGILWWMYRGFQWDQVLYASDYFPEIHKCAIKLIKDGKAYVDELTAEAVASFEEKEYENENYKEGRTSQYYLIRL